MTNADIANMLSLTADLLDIKGENSFKVRAYRNAARLIENSSKDFEKLVIPKLIKIVYNSIMGRDKLNPYVFYPYIKKIFNVE
jgi:DNA polymerase/3'-5' exonuclease PolX